MPDGSPQHKILTRRTRRIGQHFHEALSDEIRRKSTHRNSARHIILTTQHPNLG